MKRNIRKLLIVGTLFVVSIVVSQANAAITSVSGPASSRGTLPQIISPPTDILEDYVTNTGMEGFNESQGVVTTVAHVIDGGGTIPAGTKVDSHMIFLNTPDNFLTTNHFQVDWTFSGVIIGVMSDREGRREAASTFELGAPGTNYTMTFPGSGAAAPFGDRGLEAQAGGNGSRDGYRLLGPSTLRVDMRVREPGDWIRVITLSLTVVVEIYIKPGSYPNSINPNAGGVIPVAILTTDTFDAGTVDPATVELEGAGARGKGKSGNYGSLEDVDGDGDLDLVVQVVNEIDWAPDATEATLRGNLKAEHGGIPIVGSDSVNIVPPEQ